MVRSAGVRVGLADATRRVWWCGALQLLVGCASGGAVLEDAARHPAPIYLGAGTSTARGSSWGVP
jgi:hypothetical protein